VIDLAAPGWLADRLLMQNIRAVFGNLFGFAASKVQP
jgi:hypothetical protein